MKDDSVNSLVETVKRLRAPDGCPWDREQTHESLRRSLLEECYEVLECIDAQDWDHLYDELGDLLLQVLLHSEIARERGAFSFGDVVQGLSDKLIRRHPHVFGDVKQPDNPEEALALWKEIKRMEKERRVN